MNIQNLQTATSPGFSWTISLNGLMIIATIVGATYTIIKTMFSVCRPIVKSWTEIQEGLKQTAENSVMIRELKGSNDKLIIMYQNMEPRLRMMEDFMRQNLGKRVKRGIDLGA